MSRPSKVVIILSVARSEEKLRDPTSRFSFAVLPDGGLYPFGGAPVFEFRQLPAPEPLTPEQVTAVEEFARRAIEGVLKDPSRDRLEKRFESPPEDWPQ